MVKPISMYCHGCGDIKFYNMPCACTGVAQLQWADSAKTFRPVDVKFPGTATYVDGPRIGQAAEPDPWVKVGTTTIDGTLVDIANVLDVSSWPIDWARDAAAAIDLFMHADTPWLVGGRRLVAKRSHVNAIDETAIIHCDIVRRQSEIEAEGAAKQAEFDREVATMEARDYPHGLPRPPCPECGPHGNRGEVLLASSWAKCTTCAGGKPGDLWGDVHPTSIDAMADGPTDGIRPVACINCWRTGGALDVSGMCSECATRPGRTKTDDEYQRVSSHFDPVGHKPGQLENLADLHLAELGNLRRSLMGPPDDMSREEYRRIMFGELVP